MKRILFFVLFSFLIALSACSTSTESINLPELNPVARTLTATDTLIPENAILSSATVTPPNSPSKTPVPTPETFAAPTADSTCNIAEWATETMPEVQITSGKASIFTLSLTNIGTCTWTTEYSIEVLSNSGLMLEPSQSFSQSALPGETVDLVVNLTASENIGSHVVVWALQDARGLFFGVDGEALIVQKFSVVEQEIEVSVNYLWGEVCTSETPNTSLPRYARLMHDPQWMPWSSRMRDPDWPKGYHYDWYPETVQLWTKPKGGDGSYLYSLAWLRFLRAIQPDDEAAVWITRIAAGLFNRKNDFIPIFNLDQVESLPKAEGISSGGNVVKILETKNGSGRIEMLFVGNVPPNLEGLNYERTPWLITKFTSVSLEGDLGNAGGIDVYFPNLARQEEGYWVDLARVELFPALPLCATVRQDIHVYDAAFVKEESFGVLIAGRQIVIREYFLSGSDVWGRVRDGWIKLVHQVEGRPVYPTSWSMETRPPIVFPEK